MLSPVPGVVAHTAVYLPVDGRLYLADTYNSKLKVLEPATRTVFYFAVGSAVATVRPRPIAPVTASSAR